MERIRYLLIIFSVFFVSGLFAQVNLVEYEYWFNNDYENVQIVPIAPASQHELNAEIDASVLSDGVNVFNIRYKDENHVYSNTLSKVFFKNAEQLTVNKNLIAYEYWFNNDYSNVQIEPITPSSQHELNTNIDVSDLSDGLNVMSIRYKDNNNVNSSTLSKIFYKKENGIVNNKINGFQFWFDDDFENAVYISLQAPSQQLNLSEDIDLTHIQHGEHIVHYQFQDSANIWSIVSSDTIEKTAYPIADYTFTILENCDSTVITFSDLSVDADTYLWNFGDGNTDTVKSPVHTYSVPGKYLVELTVTDTLAMIDSTKQASINFYGYTSSTLSVTACDSYVAPSGAVYNSSNTYTDTIPNHLGCDSIITIHATINYTTTAIDAVTACDSYMWIDGNTYTESNNTATHTLTNANGCDSVITLNLTINQTPDVSVSQDDLSLTSNAIGADFQWVDCDNNFLELPGETDQSFIASVSGNYAVIVSNNGCADTSFCINIPVVTILENSFNDEIILYPNPSDGKFNVELGKIYNKIEYTIFDMHGAILLKGKKEHAKMLPISLKRIKGNYLIEISAKEHKAILKIIIQ